MNQPDRPPSIDPRRDLPWSLRVRVEHVRVDRRRDDHDPGNKDTQADRDDHVTPDTLETYSHDDDAEDHDRRSHVYWDQAGFGLETTLMVALISCACKIVDPVAHSFT